jgi:protein-tyrosine phosphatase
MGGGRREAAMADGWALAGAPNARDLGGFVGAGGRPIRRGVLVRASALGRLRDDDLPVLDRLGLACVLDLRSPSEVEVAPPDRLAGEPTVVRLPVFDPDHPVFTYVSAVMLGHDLTAYEGLAREGTPSAMAAIYRWFVSGAAAREGFAAAVRVAARTDRLPLLFHCAAGKDRTGWLSVVLLHALGVDEPTIRADYLRTNDATAGVREQILARMAERRPGLDMDAVRPVLEVRDAYLDAAFDEIAQRYGDLDGYLRAGLGLDDGVVEALRSNLLEDAQPVTMRA